MKGNNSTDRIQVAISIDNSGSLVTDSGEERRIACEWKVPKHFTLPGDTKSVTIKAHNDQGYVGGIVASFKSSLYNIVTDASWECADVSSCDTTNCTGYAWRKAISYGYINEVKRPWRWKKADNEIKGIEQSAQWIWVSHSKSERVWCKKTFGE